MRELKFAPFVRLEVDCEMPLEVVQRLTAELGLSDQNDVYTVCGPLALGGANTLEILLLFQMFFFPLRLWTKIFHRWCLDLLVTMVIHPLFLCGIN